MNEMWSTQQTPLFSLIVNAKLQIRAFWPPEEIRKMINKMGDRKLLISLFVALTLFAKFEINCQKGFILNLTNIQHRYRGEKKVEEEETIFFFANLILFAN